MQASVASGSLSARMTRSGVATFAAGAGVRHGYSVADVQTARMSYNAYATAPL